MKRCAKSAPDLPFGARTRSGWYPLHVAVLTGNQSLVELVVSQPTVRLNARDHTDHESHSQSDAILRTQFSRTLHRGSTRGATALHYACMIANEGIIKFLIERGASVEAVDSRNRKPLEYFQLCKSNSTALSSYNELLRVALMRQSINSDSKHF